MNIFHLSFWFRVDVVLSCNSREAMSKIAEFSRRNSSLSQSVGYNIIQSSPATKITLLGEVHRKKNQKPKNKQTKGRKHFLLPIHCLNNFKYLQLIPSPCSSDRKGLCCCAIHEAKKELHRYSCFFDKWYYKTLKDFWIPEIQSHLFKMVYFHAQTR